MLRANANAEPFVLADVWGPRRTAAAAAAAALAAWMRSGGDPSGGGSSSSSGPVRTARVVAQTPVDLAALVAAGGTPPRVDGVDLQRGDVVLLVAQVDARENGLWTCGIPGPSGRVVVPSAGSLVRVAEGARASGWLYTCTAYQAATGASTFLPVVSPAPTKTQVDALRVDAGSVGGRGADSLADLRHTVALRPADVVATGGQLTVETHGAWAPRFDDSPTWPPAWSGLGLPVLRYRASSGVAPHAGDVCFVVPGLPPERAGVTYGYGLEALVLGALDGAGTSWTVTVRLAVAEDGAWREEGSWRGTLALPPTGASAPRRVALVSAAPEDVAATGTVRTSDGSDRPPWPLGTRGAATPVLGLSLAGATPLGADVAFLGWCLTLIPRVP